MSIDSTAKNHTREGITVPSSTPTLLHSLTSNTREYPLQNIRGKMIFFPLLDAIQENYFLKRAFGRLEILL